MAIYLWPVNRLAPAVKSQLSLQGKMGGVHHHRCRWVTQQARWTTNHWIKCILHLCYDTRLHIHGHISSTLWCATDQDRHTNALPYNTIYSPHLGTS